MTTIDNGSYKLTVNNTRAVVTVRVGNRDGDHEICLTIDEARAASAAIDGAIRDARTYQHDAETASILS